MIKHGAYEDTNFSAEGCVIKTVVILEDYRINLQFLFSLCIFLCRYEKKNHFMLPLASIVLQSAHMKDSWQTESVCPLTCLIQNLVRLRTLQGNNFSMKCTINFSDVPVVNKSALWASSFKWKIEVFFCKWIQDRITVWSFRLTAHPHARHALTECCADVYVCATNHIWWQTEIIPSG